MAADGAAITLHLISMLCNTVSMSSQFNSHFKWGVPFLDRLYLHKNVQLIQKRSRQMGRFNFLALNRTDFQCLFFSPVKYNNGLCHRFKAVHVDILFEIRCSEITLHNITCYWSEKQPVSPGALLVHISSRCKTNRKYSNRKRSAREQCAIQR